jgi:LysM repeat protein
MRRIKSSHVLFVLLIAMLVVPMSTALAEDRHPQAENLLENPGFEDDYVAFDPIGDVKVAPNWEPWYIDGSQERQDEGYERAPSYYWASEDTDPGGTKEGTFAQYWKHTYGTGAGGVVQFVQVPENSKLRFSVWVRTFTCHAETIDDDCIQDDAAWMGVQLGVDPAGGEDFYNASAIHLPGIGGTNNNWEEITLEVDACEGTSISVYVMSHPDFPRQLNKTWVDNASLIRLGDADCTGTGTGTSGEAAAAPPAPAEVPFVTPQPPQDDGSIVHTVELGQTLSSIAVAYYNQGHTDLTVPRIKELNNLSSNIIYVGQKLTILPPGSVAGAAPAAPAEPEEPEEPAEDEESAEPEEPAEDTGSTDSGGDAGAAGGTGDATSGQVCMSLFDDANSNTLRDPEELLLAGGTLTLSNSTGMMENYTTDGATEPHCFPSLTPGEYVAAATAPAGFGMTTVSSWSIQVDGGANLDLTFGASGSGEVPATDDTPEDEEGGSGGALTRILIGVSGLLVLAVAGGLGAYFLVFRRN